MKKIFIALAVLVNISAVAQVQYGGQIRAANNPGVIGLVGRTNDALKVWDSLLNAKIPTLTLVGSALKVDNSAVTQPVSGTFWQATQPVSISGNQAVNVAQINGVTPLMGNGVTGTGSQRVTIASDNTAISVNNTQQGTASQNVAQVNGVTTLTGNGTTGTGSQRVTIASDNTAFSVNSTLQTGTNQIGHLEANQSVNVAQINGVTPLMGAGNTGTGSPRVTIASDQATLPVSIAVPTSGGYSVDSRTALANTVVSAKASAGQLYGYYWYNPNSSAVYIQVFNVASGSVTLGTTTPTFVITLPATSGANVEFSNGIAMGTAISYAVTTTATGSTATSSTITGFMLYK